MMTPAVSQQSIIKHPSNHHGIQGVEAERRLKLSGGTCYLVRWSESWKSYALSVYCQQKPKDIIEHFKISVDAGKYKIEGNETNFDTLEDLLAHYEKNSIHHNFKAIGHCFTRAEYIKKQEEQGIIDKIIHSHYYAHTMYCEYSW